MSVAGKASSVEEWIRCGRSGSDVNRIIADFLEINFAKVAFMSAGELGQAAGVSQASVTRFARSLGFAGFGEWSKELQRMIRAELSGPDRLWFSEHPTLHAPDEAGDRVVLAEHLHLQSLNDILLSPEFEALATSLIAAKRVVVIGARASATLIPYLHYFLSKVRGDVFAAFPGDTLWERLPTEDPQGALVVALGFPRYPRVLIDLVTELADHQFCVAAVSDHLHSPVAQRASPVVVVPVTTASLFDSYAAPLTLFNLLIRRVAQLTPERSMERLHRIEQLDREHGVYD